MTICCLQEVDSAEICCGPVMLVFLVVLRLLSVGPQPSLDWFSGCVGRGLDRVWRFGVERGRAGGVLGWLAGEGGGRGVGWGVRSPYILLWVVGL